MQVHVSNYNIFFRSRSISNDARPAWMRTLHTTATNWLAMVPEVIKIKQ